MFWRNFITLLRRYSASSTLNIVGMAIAFAAVYLIAVQVTYDLSFNRVIPNSERIYRLEHPNWGDKSGIWDCSWNRVTPDALVQICPEVEAAGSISVNGDATYQNEWSIKRNSTIDNFTIKVGGAETEAFEVFSFEFVEGGIDNFTPSDGMLISESIAKRYNLSVGDALHGGRGAKSKHTMTIVGIFKDFPMPSSLALSEGFVCLPDITPENENYWGTPFYIRLQEGASVDEIEKRMYNYMLDFYVKYGISEEDAKEYIATQILPRLNPIADLYFAEDTVPESVSGNSTTTYTLIAIAILILIISFINFVNFFFALIPSRIRAVNNYKIFGAPTIKLRLNFLFETVGLILVSLFGAAVIVVLFADTPLREYISTSVAIGDNWALAGVMALCVILFGVVVSLYPAWYITKFSPAFVIKGDFSASKAGRVLRHTLVGVQYVISITLIICALFVYRQHHFMLSRDMGFDKENLLSVTIPWEAINSRSDNGAETDYTKRDAILGKLKQNPQIKDVVLSCGQFVSYSSGGYYHWGREINGEYQSLGVQPVSWDFLKVMGIEIVEGRDFMPSDEVSETGAMIFNQKAVEKFGISLETIMEGHTEQRAANIVGICKNFDSQSATYNIQPYAFLVYGKYGGDMDMPRHAYIRTIAGTDIPALRDFIHASIMELSPESDPEKVVVKFFDDELEAIYSKEQKLSTLIALFSFLSIVISIIGVFGLVLFETQYRRREIGIRRVYGASLDGILSLFNRKYIYIVAICSAVSIPLSYYIIDRWMQQYVYRTPMSWWVYAVAIAIILTITVVTVTLRSWRAATENPADVVKSN